jgi:hypothetical protein
MASPSKDSNIQVVVHDFPGKSVASLSAKPTIWHPLEHLNGHVAIHSTEDFELEKITIYLQGSRVPSDPVETRVMLTALGHSRVWIESLKDDGELIREVSSYKVSKLLTLQVFQCGAWSLFLTT